MVGSMTSIGFIRRDLGKGYFGDDTLMDFQFFQLESMSGFIL